jgi:FkbM family methyltransferase
MPITQEILGSRAQLEDTSRRQSGGVMYEDHRLLCRLLGKYCVFVDTRDLMLAPRLVLDGFWEPWVTLAIARHLRPGMHCIDVGANYGYYSILMADGCLPGGRVAACEPNPLLAETYLPRNLRLNGFFSNVDVVQKVICDTDGEAIPFVVHDDDFAVSSMVRWAYDRPATTIQATTATVDAICRDWPQVDLVKIDAEGAEALVWDGMTETRARCSSLVTVIELHLQRDPKQTAEFLENITVGGYQLRSINYDGDVVSTDAARILSNSQEHWTLWLRR